MEKLAKLKMLSETGTFQGGFATLTSGQLLKLKGGSGTNYLCNSNINLNVYIGCKCSC